MNTYLEENVKKYFFAIFWTIEGIQGSKMEFRFNSLFHILYLEHQQSSIQRVNRAFTLCRHHLETQDKNQIIFPKFLKSKLNWQAS